MSRILIHLNINNCKTERISSKYIMTFPLYGCLNQVYDLHFKLLWTILTIAFTICSIITTVLINNVLHFGSFFMRTISIRKEAKCGFGGIRSGHYTIKSFFSSVFPFFHSNCLIISTYRVSSVLCKTVYRTF